MTQANKPYRIIRKYYSADVVKTYTNDYATLDKAYKAIVRMIDEAESYTFDLHRIVTVREKSRVVAELRNEAKPCIISIKDLVTSYQVDPKYTTKLLVN